MLENKTRTTRHLLIGALGLTASLAMAPQAFAADTMGYVTSTGGEAWTTAGGCLTSLNENPAKMAECGDDMGKKEVTVIPEKVTPPAKVIPVKKVAGAINCDTTVNFDFDRSALKADMKKMLDAMAAKVNASEAAEKVTIVGHTDSVGTEAYNMGLSNRRAKAVSSYLADKGITVTSVSGKGESSPISKKAAENRRAEITCN